MLLFGVVSVFLVGSAQRGGSEGRRVNGLSTTQADAVPIDQILSRIETSTGSGVYDLVLVSAPNPGFDDLSKQLLTTLATLVVAIAAFYFGASTVTNAVETVRPKGPPPDNDGDEVPDATAAAALEVAKAEQAQQAAKAERVAQAAQEEEARRVDDSKVTVPPLTAGAQAGHDPVDASQVAPAAPADGSGDPSEDVDDAAVEGSEAEAAGQTQAAGEAIADRDKKVDTSAQDQGLAEADGPVGGREFGEGRGE